jgi:hypothetical protein
MLLILEIAVGVAAGIVLGFFVLANRAAIWSAVEKIGAFAASIAILAAISWGIAWVIEAGSTHSQPSAQAVNDIAGNVMAGLVVAGFIVWLLLRSVVRFRDRHSDGGGAEA